MKKISFILAVFFLFMANLFAQNQKLSIGKASAMMNEFVLVSQLQNDNQITIRFDLNELELIEVETGYGKAFIATSNKAPFITEQGAPELFYLTSTSIIPDTGGSELEISYGQFQDFNNIEIAPSKGSLSRSVDPATVPYTKGSVYQVNEFYPGTLASLREPFIMRDIRGQSIDVYPVQYNPVTKVLRIYSEITITINNTRSAGLNEFNSQERYQTIDPQFNEMYSNMFINHSVVQGRGYPTGEDGELLIICHPTFMTAMKPYVDWKRTIGRKTTMVSTATTGTTATAIKTYILNYYNNPNNNLSYVLLVGDSPQIPPHTTNSVSSDVFYGQLVGSDPYLEVLIGRISAETVEHVQTQVERTIWYERDINTSATWLKTAVGLAANEGNGGGHDGGEADYVHTNNIRNRLLNYGYNPVYQEYTWNCPGITNTTVAQISSRFNGGIGVANYCNHGNETAWALSTSSSGYLSYANSQVNALTNAGKLPYIFSVACLNGKFNHSSPCFAEAWMRATQNNQPTGAVATLMATISLSWKPPMTAQDEFNYICLELPASGSYGNSGIKRTFAGAALNATQRMMMVHGTTPGYLTARADFDSWTVFGDPTLMIRTKTPQAMTVSHSSTVPLGANAFSVSCNVNGALVAMSYTDKSNEVHIMGTATVSNGVANLTFTPISLAYPIKVTVTGRDRVTYQGNVSVQCPATNFTTPTVSTTQTVTGGNINVQNVTVTNGATLTIKAACNISVQNVTVKNNSKLILDAVGEVNIIKDFDVQLGSQFEIKYP